LVRPAFGILLGSILVLAVATGAGAASDQAVADARALLEDGNPSGALRQAKEILLDDPRNVGALYIAGVASLSLDRLNDAEKYLEKAIRVAPDAPEVEYKLGVALVRIADSYQERGKKKIAAGVYDQALKHFENELARSPEHPEAIEARASTYIKAGKLPDATDALEQWVATNPGNVEAYLALVRLYTSEGNVDAAGATLAKMPRTDPAGRADATYRVARTYYQQEQPEKARPLLEDLRALQAEPWQVPALEALDRLDAGETHQAAATLIGFIDMDPPPEEVEVVAVAYHELYKQTQRSEMGSRNAESEETLPKLTMRTAPKYPKDASRYGVEGGVLLLAVVRQDGSVGRVSVVTSSATRHESLYRPQLEQAALEAVRQWQYEPARRDGKPVDFPITINIGFARR
jgi:TonB family protein